VSEPFTVPIDALDYPTPPERQVKLWVGMIRAKAEVPPIKVRSRPNLPGRWLVISGGPAIEAAKRELGATSISCEAV